MYAIYHAGTKLYIKRMDLRNGWAVQGAIGDAKKFKTEEAARKWLAAYLDAGYGLTSANTEIHKV